MIEVKYEPGGISCKIEGGRIEVLTEFAVEDMLKSVAMGMSMAHDKFGVDMSFAEEELKKRKGILGWIRK